jgi:DNA-directed RNA polymerase subunit RPC12/RpoP
VSAKFEWDEIKGQIYECSRCGARFKGEKLILRNRIVCPECGYRVIKKVKPPVVHRVKAV